MLELPLDTGLTDSRGPDYSVRHGSECTYE